MREKDDGNQTEEQLARALAQLKRAATAPPVPRELVPVYNALRDLRYELSRQEPALLEDILDRAEEHLDAALPHFRPQEPSQPPQPPGATIPSNQGVGMGEGEKVAQDSAEEAREVDEAVDKIINEHIQRAVGRLICPPGYLELSKELLRRAQEALKEDDSPEAEYYGNCRDANTIFPSPRPPCDCPHEMRSDCATCNPDPAKGVSFSPTPSHGTIPPYPQDQLRELTKPCPPAPPPSVEPAEETSSGRERCGEGTAGGAGEKAERWKNRDPDLKVSLSDLRCCPYMQKYEMVTGWYPPRLKSPHADGSFMAAQVSRQPFFCPWCATPLREDGELRVGRESARPPRPEEQEAAKEALAPELTLDGEGCIHPAGSRDTCKEAEEGGGE